MNYLPPALLEILRKPVPPVYFFAALFLMIAMDQLVPVLHLIYTPLRILGGVLALLGLVLCGWSILQFRQAGTPLRPFEKPLSLVQTGPFQYSRNPVYLGMLVTLSGTWIALGSLSPLLPVILFFTVIQEVFVKQEEIFLAEEIGEPYHKYCQSVRRWL